MGIIETVKKNVEKKVEKEKTKKLVEDIAINAFIHLASQPYAEEDNEENSPEELQEELLNVGLDYWELREMSLKERTETINSTGLDYEDYEDLFWDCNNVKTEDELKETLGEEGLTFEGLCRMDCEKRKEVLWAVGLDYDDYEELFDNYDEEMSYYSSNTYDYVLSDSIDYKNTSRKDGIIKAFCKKHLKTVIIAVLVIFLVLAFVVMIHYLKKLTPIGYDSEELIGEYWEEVIENLEDEGFTKISSEALYDLEYEDISEEGQVFEVVIKGETDFSEDNKFPYDTKIMIKYHTLKLVTLPFSHKGAKKLHYPEAIDELKEAGFVNIKLEPINDLVLGWLTKDGEIEKVTVNGLEKYSTEDEFRPDVEIVVHYHTFKDK